jgi:Mlc titration factor MtfA (ptsG expression regulator)
VGKNPGDAALLEHLAVDEKKSLKTLVEQFLAEKEFSTAGGLELSDEICVSIAAQGCLPILNLGLAAYRELGGHRRLSR